MTGAVAVISVSATNEADTILQDHERVPFAGIQDAMKLFNSTPPAAELHPIETAMALASAEAFELHRSRLQRWLPFAGIACMGPADAGSGDLEPLHMLVYVSAAELEVTIEILAGFFAPAQGHRINPARATFVDEGSAPVMVMHVISSGSALDEPAPVRNARTDYGGLLRGQEQFATDGIRFRRATKDGQQAGTDASLRQAVASV